MTPRDPGTPVPGGLDSIRGRVVEMPVREDIKVTSAPVAAEILQRLGFVVHARTEGDVELAPDRILLVRGNARWYKRTLARVAALPSSRRPGVVVWHTEALPMPAAAGAPREWLTAREVAKIILRDRRINDHYSNARYLRHLSRTDIAAALAVSTSAYQAFLAQEGIEAELAPFAYHPSYGHLMALERDIDVLFLGEYRVRRRRRILRRLKDEGLDVVVLGSQSPTKGYWGERRTELLNRTKILLHLPRYPGHLSDRHHMGMATGALVVSEPVYLPDPLRPGVHYVECSVAEMADTVRRYLADAEARQRITNAAHRFLTQELTLERTYARLMELAAEAWT